MLCCAGVAEHPMGPFAHEARAYGQSRGVMPFSCAYFAAAASTRGRTSAWSGAIQSVMTVHCFRSHCWNFTLPPPLMIAAGQGKRGDKTLRPHLFERCGGEGEVFEPPLHLHPGQGLVAEVAHGRTQRLRDEQAPHHTPHPMRRTDISFGTSPLAPGIDVLEYLLDERVMSPHAVPGRADEATGHLPGRYDLLLRAGRVRAHHLVAGEAHQGRFLQGGRSLDTAGT